MSAVVARSALASGCRCRTRSTASERRERRRSRGRRGPPEKRRVGHRKARRGERRPLAPHSEEPQHREDPGHQQAEMKPADRQEMHQPRAGKFVHDLRRHLGPAPDHERIDQRRPPPVEPAGRGVQRRPEAVGEAGVIPRVADLGRHEDPGGSSEPPLSRPPPATRLDHRPGRGVQGPRPTHRDTPQAPGADGRGEGLRPAGVHRLFGAEGDGDFLCRPPSRTARGIPSTGQCPGEEAEAEPRGSHGAERGRRG